MHHPIRVAFICVGNSCRSQMAEGFVRQKYRGEIEPLSAGIAPAAIVQPETIACMQEIGISLDGQRPKPVSALDWKEVDVVVNMSGAPLFQYVRDFQGINLIWMVGDPIGKPPNVYRQVRDRIEQLVDDLANKLRNHQRVKQR